ncbi:hypothetical protein AgCh_034774 [Apium graveolens]
MEVFDVLDRQEFAFPPPCLGPVSKKASDVEMWQSSHVLSKQKGKEKVLAVYSFNENGPLCQKAIKILDNRSMSFVSKVFDSDPLDLEAEIFEGIYTKDILEGPMVENLDLVLANAKPIKPRLSDVRIDTMDKFWKLEDKNPRLRTYES